MKRKAISVAAGLLLSAALLLTAAGCDPWDDAVELFRSIGSSEEESSSAESSESSESSSPAPDDGEVIDTLGAVVSGDCPWSPGRSVSGWLLEYYPDGDWSVTESTVDYWSTNPEDGTDAHFGFAVSDDGSFELDICELDGDRYTLEELVKLFS